METGKTGQPLLCAQSIAKDLSFLMQTGKTGQLLLCAQSMCSVDS